MNKLPALIASCVAIIMMLAGCRKPEPAETENIKRYPETAGVVNYSETAGVVDYPEPNAVRNYVKQEEIAGVQNTSTATLPSQDEKIQGNWRYEEDIDKMTGKVSKFAFIKAENSFDFDFPYNGSSYGMLMIRKKAIDGLSVMFFISKGQIICHISCSIKVKFDDKPPMTFTGSMPDDYSNTSIFLSPASKFVANIKKAKQTLVGVTYYQSGSQVSEFKTEGFQWEGKTGK